MNDHPCHDANAKNSEVENLGNEIFRLVEAEQGYGLLSDGIVLIEDRDTLFAVVRGALKHNRRAGRILEKWLKTHDEY